MAEFRVPEREEFDATTRRTAQARKHQLLATDARYDRRTQRVMITLNSGAIVGFPLSVLPGLERATPDDLRQIEVEGGGYGLHVASLDADISIPSLLADNSARPSCGERLRGRMRRRPTDDWVGGHASRGRLR